MGPRTFPQCSRRPNDRSLGETEFVTGIASASGLYDYWLDDIPEALSADLLAQGDPPSVRVSGARGAARRAGRAGV